jgi:hypothetical protein
MSIPTGRRTQLKGTSNRTRLLLTLSVVGAGALIFFVAAAWADTWVQYVGSGGCAEQVAPGSDQREDGFSYNYETDAYADSGYCTHFEVPGHMRVYENKGDGSWVCSAAGYSHVSCIAPSWPYSHSHCINLDSSTLWMDCWKYKQSP